MSADHVAVAPAGAAGVDGDIPKARDLTRSAGFLVRQAIDIHSVVDLAEQTGHLPSRPLRARVDALIASATVLADAIEESA